MSQTEAEKWAEYQRTGSIELRNQLVESYLYLVTYLASKVSQKMAQNAILDFEGLKSAGFDGLLRAVEMFDPTRGLKFNTYATKRIRGAMLDEMRKLDWVPRSHRDSQKRGETTPTEMNSAPEVIAETSATDPAMQLQAEDDRAEFWEKMTAELNDEDTRLIVGHYRDGVPLPQIARQIGKPQGWTKWRLQKLLEMLRGQLAG